MLIGPLESWDDDVVDRVCTMTEVDSLEKKSSAKFQPKSEETRKEIGKQVSAFANSGGGALVFGINNSGTLDEGVPALIGRQPIKEWCESLVPSMVMPPVFGVRARHMSRRGQHREGFGILAIEIPLSDTRPHWVRGSPDIAYLRLGEHSLPMPAQTFLDMSARQGGHSAVIYSAGISPPLPTLDTDSDDWVFNINPLVGLAVR